MSGKGWSCMDKDSFIAQWRHLAAMDLKTAEFLLNMHPVPVEIICFNCQQSAEKYLKGYLALNNVEPPKIHDLRILLKMCVKKNPRFESLADECSTLTVYGVQPRYPADLELEEQDMRLALNCAREIRDFVVSIAPELQDK